MPGIVPAGVSGDVPRGLCRGMCQGDCVRGCAKGLCQERVGGRAKGCARGVSARRAGLGHPCFGWAFSNSAEWVYGGFRVGFNGHPCPMKPEKHIHVLFTLDS
ncbi:MAG: hypothetical protein NC417_13285 [Candidatus Gastranaerophilales bacterium]|nr:hypothetical protein [Candidatus Gastranaerophilales bacterium]